jgi:3',5'-cyclic-AMP phosphodiesterase
MLLAQISDTHVREAGQLCYGKVPTALLLSKAVDRLNSLRPVPDVVIVTGDLVDHGTAAEYAQLRALLAPLAMPFYLLVGNHDHRDNLRAAFPEHACLRGRAFLQYTIEDFPVRLVMLDTNVPGQAKGRLCDERIEWLAARLAEQPARPTVIAMHHPPFKSGNTPLDRFDLAGADALSEVVSRYRNIEAILCGHLHRPTQTRFAGTLAMTCPSTAHQHHFGLGDSPFGFDMEPPSFQLHRWDGLSLVTHTALVDRFDGPYSFGDGRKMLSGEAGAERGETDVSCADAPDRGE